MRLSHTVRRLVLVAAFATLAAACGGGASTEGVASLSTSATSTAPLDDGVEQSREEALLAFAECMRDNGVDIEDPTVDADGNLRLTPPGGEPGRIAPGDDDFREAREACGELLDGAALAFGGDFDRTELEDTLVAFAECMRDNGYDMPDPDFSSFGPGAGGGGGPFGGIDRDDPTFQAAAEACGDILAGFAGPGAGRPGGGGGNG